MDTSTIQRVIVNGSDVDSIQTNSTTAWNIATASNPYTLDASKTWCKVGGNYLYKSGGIWKYQSNNTNFDPTPAEWTVNWTNLTASRTVQVSNGWQNVYKDCRGTYNLASDSSGQSWACVGYFCVIFKNGTAVEWTDSGYNRGCFAGGAGGRSAFATQRGYNVVNKPPGQYAHTINHSCTCGALNNSYELLVNSTETKNLSEF